MMNPAQYLMNLARQTQDPFEQSCVIIVKDRGMKRPHIRVTRRTLKGK